jgi:hypothetical protein
MLGHEIRSFSLTLGQLEEIEKGLQPVSGTACAGCRENDEAELSAKRRFAEELEGFMEDLNNGSGQHTIHRMMKMDGLESRDGSFFKRGSRNTSTRFGRQKFGMHHHGDSAPAVAAPLLMRRRR